MFTLTDKALLDRAARMINGAAKELRAQYEASGWASTEAGRKAKQEYDRLLRDERDMRALGKRLCTHFDVKAAPRATEPAGNPESTPAADAGKVDSLEVMCPLCGPVLKPCNMQECRVLDAFPGMPAPAGEEVHDG